jgi:hypothetical protein
MEDGSRRFRLELRDGTVDGIPATGDSDGPEQTLKRIALASREEAAAISAAVEQVLEAAGCLVDAGQGLFQLEGPQLAALMAILQKLAQPHGCPEAPGA